jgi:hypothetical protein
VAEPRKKNPRSARESSASSGTKPKSRKQRTDKPAGQKKPRKKRASPGQAVARNARIVQLRDQYLLPWEQIAAKLGISYTAAREGYQQHFEDIPYERSLKRALEEMRAYVRVIQADRAELAIFARNLPSLDAKKDDPPPNYDPRTRIAAIHEQASLIFQEITIRQACGDLPMQFNELVADRDFEAILDGIMELLAIHDLPREAFLEIDRIIDGRVAVSVPKTHLEAVEVVAEAE